MRIKFPILPATALAATMLASCSSTNPSEQSPLKFNSEAYELKTLAMPSGDTIQYKAYEGIYYVENVEDSTYQTLNIYVPTDLKGRDDKDIPVIMRQYVGGYMASKAKEPSATDATGRALKEGYVVCIPGARGSNSIVKDKGKKVYTGTAPNALLDLKAAVRYLRYNDSRIPGNSERIFIDGTSAGGAMSALIGVTANQDDYEPYLKQMGTPKVRDNVYGAICYCPITDLNHADMEYEWLYGCTNHGARHLDSIQCRISNELAALAPDYINSLKLRDEWGNPITDGNYREYLCSFIAASAHRALQEGVEIPDSIGIVLYSDVPDMADGRAAPSFGPEANPPAAPKATLPDTLTANRPKDIHTEGNPQGNPPAGNRGPRPSFDSSTDFVKSVDLDKYLNYVASQTPLKTPPAFDQMGVIIPTPSPENKLFADSEGHPNNLTEFSYRHREHNPKDTLPTVLEKRIYLMNPMYFIGSSVSKDVAPKWYIRHGAKDRDTSFLVPVNLATKLKNAGYDVDFFLPWNRPHSGDYNLDDLFAWIGQAMKDD